MIKEPAKTVGYKSWESTVYFLGVMFLWFISLCTTSAPLGHKWPTVILIALFIAVLDASPAPVYVAQITVTSSVIFVSSTNVGLFPTEVSLLFSLPFLFLRYKRGIFVVLFNTSLYGVSTVLSFSVYKTLGGQLSYYGHHLLAVLAYVMVYMVMTFVGTNVALFLNYRTAMRVNELVQKNWFYILGAYAVEMILGVVAGILYQLYGMWGLIAVVVVLWLVIQMYKRYFDMTLDAETDALTGLYSRKAVQQQTARNINKGRSLSLMMIDVDHFKHVNDSLGHSAGDMVLQETAQLLTEFIGPSDVIGRYGGEEFCLLSFNEHPGLLAERLRTAVSQFSFSTYDDLQLTVSIGIALFPQDANEWSSLFECADKALYEAKLHRNTVRVYSPTLSGVGAHT